MDSSGVPACVAPGTGIPLSLSYIHFAVLASMITAPLGVWTGSRVAILETRLAEVWAERRLRLILAPATLVIGLAILAVLRLA